MRALLFAAVTAMPAIAWAQPPALHDKAYYAAHKTVRETTLRWCHSDATYADLFDCQNAEAADAGTIGSAPQQTIEQTLRDPNYWVRNPVARDGAMVQCSRRGIGDRLILPYCGAVRQGAALAGKRT